MLNNRLTLVFSLTMAMLVLVAGGCSKNEVPEGRPLTPSAGPETSPSGGELSFSMPNGWVQEAPNSAMRKAQYRLPGEAGDAELAIFVGIGGGVQQNVDRWIGQFQAPDGRPAAASANVGKREVGGLKVTTVDVSGSYTAAMMGPMAGGSVAPLDNYRMLGAVIEAPSGPWFLKLTGPSETVSKWEASFTEFVDSVQVK